MKHDDDDDDEDADDEDADVSIVVANCSSFLHSPMACVGPLTVRSLHQLARLFPHQRNLSST